MRCLKSLSTFRKSQREFDITDISDYKFTIKAAVDNASSGSIVLDQEGNLLGFVAKPGGVDTTCVSMEGFLKWMADNTDSIAPQAISMSLPDPKKIIEKTTSIVEENNAFVLNFTNYAMMVLRQSTLVIYSIEKNVV